MAHQKCKNVLCNKHFEFSRCLFFNLTFQFNHTRPDKKEKRQEILKQLFNTKGSFHIEAPFNCDYGYNIEIGNNFHANDADSVKREFKEYGR
ncbi:maltose acetyltransferase domain-containing protein [Desulfosporosinus sp.]|uniref:maltose acetyltransferase domain-containing protein n=1 Tax=Desulfosporosinus sp. TaxID=157907 RepID=UPI00230B1AF3|nr:maltose acetyltransferase domain-containing protein [Desulfosporosinus sp.]MDA8222704.1 hypothetical protein [Desulfitobacterium hafniense]